MMKFWDNGLEHDGYIWIGPTDQEYCGRCPSGKKSPIPTGVAVHFKDSTTKEEFVTGRTCYKNHTELKLSQIPVIGMGFEEAQIRTNEGTSRKGKAAQALDRAAAKTPEQAQLWTACENVLLRTVEMEDRFGIQIGQPGLRALADEAYTMQLAPSDVSYVERYVRNGEKMGKPTLDHLQRINVTAWELRTLERKSLKPNEQNWVGQMWSNLRRYKGLTTPQMEVLEQVADRYGINLAPKNIRFPENDARLQSFRNKTEEQSGFNFGE